MANIFEVNRTSNTLTLGTTDTDIVAPPLTASLLVGTDADKSLVSVSNLASWITGTANQITVTDDSDGTVTLSAPQDLHTAATPTFGGIIVANGGTIGQAAGPLIAFDDTNNYLEITGCNVGIGTATPTSKIHVVRTGIGADSEKAMFLSAGSDYYTGFRFENTHADGAGLALGWSFLQVTRKTGGYGGLGASSLAIRQHLAASNAYRMVITDTGNVGIGTLAPLARFVVSNDGVDGFEIDPSSTAGIVYLTGYDRTGGTYVKLSMRASEFVWGTGATPRMYMDTSGNVGINEATPAAKLEVNGTARFGDGGSNYVGIGATGDLSFAGSSGFYPRFLTQAGEPAAGTGATQCDTSELVMWKNSGDSVVSICFNDGGTVKTVALA